MIRNEWQADAEDIRPLDGAELAIVHKLLAESDLEEAQRWLSKPGLPDFARDRWSARRLDAEVRLKDAEGRLH